MFGIANFKMYIYIALAIALTVIIGSCIWYYNWSQGELQTLRANNLKLELALEQSESAIKALQTSIEQAYKKSTKLQNDFNSLRNEYNRVSKKLSKHDIGYLASKKPVLVEKAFNNGTMDIGRCFEIVTGSALTQEEKDAIKPSQLNSSCSDIANPNFEGEQ